MNTARKFEEEVKVNPKKLLILGGLVVGLITLFSVAHSAIGTNDLGYYQIKQSLGSGHVEVVNTPGWYAKMGADVYTYQNSDMFYFSKHKLDGGDGAEAAAMKVRFHDGSLADISGALKYRLPTTDEKQITLHRDFKSYPAVKSDLVRQVVAQALLQTATLMNPEEVYSTRRAEFGSMVEDQIKNGIYETVATEKKTTDVEGNEFIERSVAVKLDAQGRAIHEAASPLARYGIEVVSFVVKDVDFDPTIDALIAKKKEAEQQKVVARANAEKAKQDAITATEQGKAQVATAQAAELVEKIKATTQAQKAYEVSVLAHKQAGEEAAAATVRGQADAAVAKLKVAAGLTPLERATLAKDTAIGVAHEMAGIKLPQLMVLGGSGGTGAAGGHLDPFAAVGLESFMHIQKQLTADAK